MLEAARAWKRKHAVTIYTWEYDAARTFPEFSEYDVRVLPHRMPLHALSKLTAWSTLNVDADVVSAHGFPSHFTSFHHPAVVYYLHIIPGFFSALHASNPVNRAYAQAIASVDRMAVKKCAKIVANSSLTSGWARTQYRRQAPIISPGIHPAHYAPHAYDDFALCVSRLVPEKRVLQLVKAWHSGHTGGLRLVLVGMGNDGFVRQVREASEGRNITLYSEGVSDAHLKELYARCRLLVHPAHHEPFGISLLEAMASAKPVVAHASGGPKEIVTRGTGFLCPNDASMFSAIRLLARDHALAKRMGQHARKRARSFAWNTQLAKLEAILKEVAI